MQSSLVNVVFCPSSGFGNHPLKDGNRLGYDLPLYDVGSSVSEAYHTLYFSIGMRRSNGNQ